MASYQRVYTLAHGVSALRFLARRMAELDATSG